MALSHGEGRKHQNFWGEEESQAGADENLIPRMEKVQEVQGRQRGGLGEQERWCP